MKTDTRSLAERLDKHFSQYASTDSSAWGERENAEAAFVAEVAALESERTKLQGELAKLYGVPFSERCYYALKSRAEVAESTLAAVGEIARQLQEPYVGSKKWWDLYDKLIGSIAISSLATGPATAGQTCATCKGAKHMRWWEDDEVVSMRCPDCATTKEYNQ